FIFVIFIFLLINISLISAEEFGYDNPLLPKVINLNALFGNFSWNGICLDGGVEIRNDGTICATRLEVFNITSVNITQQNLTILGDAYFNGRVGIGTTSPEAPLHIFGVAAAETNLYLGTESDSIGAAMRWEHSLGTLKIGTFSSGADVIFIAGNGVEVVRILDSGNVGIGVTDSDALLEVAGTTHIQGAAILDSTLGVTGITTAGAGILIGAGTTGAGKIYKLTGSGQGFVIQTATGSSNDFLLATPAGAVILAIPTGTTTANFAGAGSFVGNVGIGTTTPQNTLNVIGDLNVTGTIYGAGDANITDTYVPYTGAFKNVDLGANNLSVDTNVLFVDSNTDRVGIGTSSPQQKLEVNGVILNNDLHIGSNADYWRFIRVTGGDLNISLQGTTADFDINIYNPTAGKAGLFVEGNVGIGTTAPDEILTLGSGTTTGNKAIHLEDHDDVFIFLEADEDNSGEDDNPYIKFSQDNTL
ncbi:hypothetical protein LCGC14_2572240, partial [marine sediment metagenome]